MPQQLDPATLQAMTEKGMTSAEELIRDIRTQNADYQKARIARQAAMQTALIDEQNAGASLGLSLATAPAWNNLALQQARQQASERAATAKGKSIKDRNTRVEGVMPPSTGVSMNPNQTNPMSLSGANAFSALQSQAQPAGGGAPGGGPLNLEALVNAAAQKYAGPVTPGEGERVTTGSQQIVTGLEGFALEGINKLINAAGGPEGFLPTRVQTREVTTLSPIEQRKNQAETYLALKDAEVRERVANDNKTHNDAVLALQTTEINAGIANANAQERLAKQQLANSIADTESINLARSFEAVARMAPNLPPNVFPEVQRLTTDFFLTRNKTPEVIKAYTDGLVGLTGPKAADILAPPVYGIKSMEDSFAYFEKSGQLSEAATVRDMELNPDKYKGRDPQDVIKENFANSLNNLEGGLSATGAVGQNLPADPSRLSVLTQQVLASTPPAQLEQTKALMASLDAKRGLEDAPNTKELSSLLHLMLTTADPTSVGNVLGPGSANFALMQKYFLAKGMALIQVGKQTRDIELYTLEDLASRAIYNRTPKNIEKLDALGLMDENGRWSHEDADLDTADPTPNLDITGFLASHVALHNALMGRGIYATVGQNNTMDYRVATAKQLADFETRRNALPPIQQSLGQRFQTMLQNFLPQNQQQKSGGVGPGSFVDEMARRRGTEEQVAAQRQANMLQSFAEREDPFMPREPIFGVTDRGDQPKMVAPEQPLGSYGQYGQPAAGPMLEPGRAGSLTFPGTAGVIRAPAPAGPPLLGGGPPQRQLQATNRAIPLGPGATQGTGVIPLAQLYPDQGLFQLSPGVKRLTEAEREQLKTEILAYRRAEANRLQAAKDAYKKGGANRPLRARTSRPAPRVINVRPPRPPTRGR